MPSYLRAGIADIAELLLPDELAKRDAEALVVPLRGTVDAPKLRPLPALFGLIQDALLAGLARGAGSAWPWTLPVKRELLEPAAALPLGPGSEKTAHVERPRHGVERAR